jgi:L-ascorbate metabolism protein UlaG (beta-lactamase superfamily)
LAEITWLGHACFRIKGRDATIITDPYDKSLGLGNLNQKAEIVTISHDNPHHNALAGVKGEPFTVQGPGEYEIKGVFVTGVWSFADSKESTTRKRNTIFLFQLDDVNVCHLGALGHTLNSHQLEALGDVDVLMLPIDNTALTSSKLTEVISQIEPRIVIPMSYAGTKGATEPGALEKFMKEQGIKEWTSQEKLTIKSSDPDGPLQVVVLEPRT